MSLFFHESRQHGLKERIIKYLTLSPVRRALVMRPENCDIIGESEREYHMHQVIISQISDQTGNNQDLNLRKIEEQAKTDQNYQEGQGSID